MKAPGFDERSVDTETVKKATKVQSSKKSPKPVFNITKTISKKEIQRRSKDCDKLKCRFCGKTFKKSAQLGGHTSKMHKGQSEKYKTKCETHQRRAADRKAYALAKEQLGDPTGFKNPHQFRIALKQIKKTIRATIQN